MKPAPKKKSAKKVAEETPIPVEPTPAPETSRSFLQKLSDLINAGEQGFGVLDIPVASLAMPLPGTADISRAEMLIRHSIKARFAHAARHSPEDDFNIAEAIEMALYDFSYELAQAITHPVAPVTILSTNITSLR